MRCPRVGRSSTSRVALPRTADACADLGRSSTAALPPSKPSAESLELPREPRLAPDGTRLVSSRFGASRSTTGDLWIYDLDGRPSIPLAVERDNRFAVWSPDGARVAFTSNRGGSYDLSVVAGADASVVGPVAVARVLAA